MSAWVYILQCSDKSYYTGSTVDINRRLAMHNDGSIKGWTSSRLPVKLLFLHEFYSLNEAISAERQIKGWSRAKKKALINSDFDLLIELSMNSKLRKKSKPSNH